MGLIELRGGWVVDPTDTDRPSGVRSIFVRDGCIVAPPPPGIRPDQVQDVSGSVVMAGGIDLHTHIGGGKANLARLLLPSKRPVGFGNAGPAGAAIGDPRSPLSAPVPSTREAGRRYLQMGYTSCFEPAMLSSNARQSHLEMADTPWLGTGGYLLLGNEERLLHWLASGASQQLITDYVGWMLHAHQALAVKVVNAGGISAFKFNQRAFDVDQPHPHWGVTPRKVLVHLARAVDQLRLPHPLHVHCSNLGRAGNIASTLATLDAVEGCRVHITHAQFHCYSDQGPHGYGSAAAQLAERVQADPKISIDVGQIVFGQTVTISADSMHQFAHWPLARPRKGILQDIQCQAGCGVLPFRYRQQQYVHSLQWTIGLELLLRIDDPWRVFLTTDHPNGGPFTAYPHLIGLLMDRQLRAEAFELLHPDVRATSSLPSLDRQYTLEEIAIITRAGPARSLGLQQLGRLTPGGQADLAIYPREKSPEAMFCQASRVYRRGVCVLSDGGLGPDATGQTYTVRPDYDPRIADWLEATAHLADPPAGDAGAASLRRAVLGQRRLDRISDEELVGLIGSEPVIVPCSAGGMDR